MNAVEMVKDAVARARTAGYRDGYETGKRAGVAAVLARVDEYANGLPFGDLRTGIRRLEEGLAEEEARDDEPEATDDD
jgi:hypothetical protein